MKSNIILVLVLSTVANAVDLKHHEQWWQNNIDTQIKTLEKWLGDINAQSRVSMRKHIQEKGYKTILDIPAGLCTEYFGYKKNNIAIEYLGIDITPKLVDRGKELGVPIQQGSIEAIPLPDNRVDVAYARHIVEHLDYYEKAVDELIRVAHKEVIVIFFIKPSHKADNIRSSKRNGDVLYHNIYNKKTIEQFVCFHPKVRNIEWEDINIDEIVLHIYLKQEQAVDFDISMGKDVYTSGYAQCMRNYARYGVCSDVKNSRVLFDQFKILYEKNNFARLSPTREERIPKIIHQIWLGSPLPEEYKAWQKTWKVLHPDWEYILWTDANVGDLKLYNKMFFDNAENYGEKSNILRYELLYQFGGVYVDMDFECIRSLDYLHHTYDFYTGIAPLDCSVLCLNNAIIGSVPGHPILEYCIETVTRDKAQQNRLRKEGAHVMRRLGRFTLLEHLLLWRHFATIGL